MGVTLKCNHVVTPAEPTWQGILPLSELDQVAVISHTSVLYFYDRPTNQDWVDSSNTKVVNTLKDSLSRALVSFYPLAGRLSWIAGRRLQLDCNVLGCELIEADSTGKISDFGDFVECSKSMFRDLVSHIDYTNTLINDIPLLSVQVTRFACGGICLGIQFSHVLMDGRSVFHFIKEWARLARGEPLQVEPFLDRLALKHIGTTVDPQVDPNQVTFAQVADSYTSENPQAEVTELLSPTLVLMTGDRIDSLKKMANKEHEAELKSRPYSRFEVITAHVWKCMTKARDLEADQITALYVIADGRSRLDPPLPSSYFGNVIVPVTTTSSAGELISKPLSYACSKVRESIKQLTNEYIKDTIEFFGKEQSLSNHQFIDDRGDLVGNSKSSNDMWVTSSLNLLAQGLDFGWGSEIYAGPPTGLGDDGNSLILPHYRHDGSVKLAIWLQDEEKSKKFIDFCVGNDTEQV
ncbi:spermidine hydroxycinnamoyl transferase-like [Silene latifolia]|uniref:spermidine hydroxycinnamoyl transferase-like n=1 Tax=Silene latifolia TaxID=37657 RepID=UPI003D77F50A